MRFGTPSHEHRHYAGMAGDHPEGLITNALFAVQDGETGAARSGFEAAIAATPKNARAWIGLGLTDLAEGNPESAARAMGAVRFLGR